MQIKQHHAKPVRKLLIGIGIVLSLIGASSTQAQPRHGLRGYGCVHPGVAQSLPIERLAANEHLDLAISLPVRNESVLDYAIQELYNPASPSYHQYLTAAQFTDLFGPTETEYETVIGYLKTHGFTVTQTYANRMVVDVKGSIADIEQTFHVKMLRYQHPTENRVFFGPDAEPSLDQDLPILDITGLDNYVIPHPKDLRMAKAGVKTNATGSGPGGGFRGNDFRAAYCPGVTLDGSGQTIGLFQLGSFYASDISSYCSQSGLPSAQITQVLLDGVSSTPAAGANTGEQSLDIELVHAMAPAARIYYYYGNNASDIWNRIASDNIAKQISSSWGVSPPPSTMSQMLQQMASQGQSVYNASGDSGFTSPFGWNDSPYMTMVGGTSLTTSGAGGAWSAETAWNGSGGCISPTFAIPSWQQGISMSANGGSTTMRNCPDVAIVGDVQIWWVYNNGASGIVGGTSAAAPLWAGFTALVNQQAVANGKATAGFINPAVYALGKGSSYTANFHDITSGSNGKPAVSGYDLVTGWGSPKGQTLINSLSGSSGGGTPGTGVTFYQDANYGGTAGQTLGVGTYTVSQLSAKGVGNDWASSVRVSSGYTVQIFADDNFGGTSWTLTADTPNFATLSPSANDMMSSCKVTQAGSTGVTFYQDANYAGTAGQTLGVGTYTLSQLSAKGVANDWASSVKVSSGYTVTIYADDNFGGTSWTLTADTPNLGTLSPSANDAMSSCKVTQGGALSDAARHQLDSLIGSVSSATAKRFSVTDSAGHTMDCAKVIANPYVSGQFIAVSHATYNSVFKVNLATSTDLMNWTWVRELGGSSPNGPASQATIKYCDDGNGFVVAWEQENVGGGGNHVRLLHFSNWSNLQNGVTDKTYDAPMSFSTCANGTPNLYSATASSCTVGFHYYSNCTVDRQASATCNWSSWTASQQTGLDNAILYWSVNGNIGERDGYITLGGYKFGTIEGQATAGDQTSWRSFVYDYQTGNADKIAFTTPGGSISFKTPKVSLFTFNGHNTCFVSLFLPVEGIKGSDGAGPLFYYTYY